MVGSDQQKPGPGPESSVLLRLRLQPKMAPAQQICCCTYICILYNSPIKK